MRVFLSYQPGSVVCSNLAVELNGYLRAHFGSESVCRNYGSGLASVLDRAVGGRERTDAPNVLVALIGPGRPAGPTPWSVQDPVRADVVTGLGRGLLCVPVVVGDAAMPSAERLPADVQPLVAKPPIRLDSGPALAEQVQDLIQRIEDWVLTPVQEDGEFAVAADWAPQAADAGSEAAGTAHAEAGAALDPGPAWEVAAGEGVSWRPSALSEAPAPSLTVAPMDGEAALDPGPAWEVAAGEGVSWPPSPAAAVVPEDDEERDDPTLAWEPRRGARGAAEGRESTLVGLTAGVAQVPVPAAPGELGGAAPTALRRRSRDARRSEPPDVASADDAGVVAAEDPVSDAGLATPAPAAAVHFRGRKALAVAVVVGFGAAMGSFWFGLLPDGVERRLGITPSASRPRPTSVTATALRTGWPSGAEGAGPLAPARPPGGVLQSVSGVPVDAAVGGTHGVLAGAQAGAAALAAQGTAGRRASAEQPSRREVLKAATHVREQVLACGHDGLVFADITVEGATGRVVNASVDGMTGDVGSCIARAVRRADFPTFRREEFRIKLMFRPQRGAAGAQ